eukprot:SAG25_NODE_19_length_23408_cov_10.997040_31_plen_343_part_01
MMLLLLSLLVIQALVATAVAPNRTKGRFVVCPSCKQDGGVWYYLTWQQQRKEEHSGTMLYYIDINWPSPWGGHCPAHGVVDIEPLLQRVQPAELEGLAGRLVGGRGSLCRPPCQHFTCALLLPGASNSTPPLTQAQVDTWAGKYYRNWTYHPEWVIPPSCLDPATCPRVSRNFTDIAQAWRVPGEQTWRMTYTFFDGVGYQTAMATSRDLVTWDQSPGVVYSPRDGRRPLSWNATPGDFDYGGAAFMGPLLSNYSVFAARELLKVGGRYYFTNFAQPLRDSCEPPPGATGLASSVDGIDWQRASDVPLLDTLPAHGAQLWEQTQIYAPNLVVHDGVVYDFYNA